MEMGQAEVTKKLVTLPSGNLAEAIYFDRPEKQVVCLSTQLNCAVACPFCASSKEGGSTVNLTVEDMITQIDELSVDNTDKVMLYSFMGEGEPFLNYKNVVRTMRILEKRENCKISVSTSGYKIREFAELQFKVPVKLQVSIHSCSEATRKYLVPVSKSIEEIRDDIAFFHDHSDNPIDLNFALIDGVNDSDEEMNLIKDMFPNEHIKISRYNPVEGSGMKGSTRVCKCLDVLEGMDVEYHETDGSKIDAACGQTRGKHEKISRLE